MLLLVPPILCCSSPMPGRREPALHSACLWEPLRLLHFLPQFCAPGLFPRSPFASHTVPPPVQEYHSNPFPPLPVLPIADDQPVPMLTGKVRVPNPSLLEALCCQTSRPGQAPWPHVCHKGGFALGSCSAGASCWYSSGASWLYWGKRNLLVAERPPGELFWGRSFSRGSGNSAAGEASFLGVLNTRAETELLQPLV